MVVCGEQIGIIALSVTSGAIHFLAVGVVGSDSEAKGVEQRSDRHVDQGDIPPDGCTDQSVFVLENIGLVGGCGNLYRDTTRIRIDLPVLLISLSIR